MGAWATPGVRARAARDTPHGQLTQLLEREVRRRLPPVHVAVSPSARSRSSEVGGGVDSSRGSVGERSSSFMVGHECDASGRVEATRQARRGRCAVAVVCDEVADELA